MLVLSRNVGEKLIVNNNVKITILEVRHGGRVRIGIEAPKDVSVHREEVWIKVKQKELEA